jgi:hypothetical protein
VVARSVYQPPSTADRFHSSGVEMIQWERDLRRLLNQEPNCCNGLSTDVGGWRALPQTGPGVLWRESLDRVSLCRIFVATIY